MSESSSVYSQNSVTAQLRLFFDLYFVVSVFCICDLSLIVFFLFVCFHSVYSSTCPCTKNDNTVCYRCILGANACKMECFIVLFVLLRQQQHDWEILERSRPNGYSGYCGNTVQNYTHVNDMNVPRRVDLGGGGAPQYFAKEAMRQSSPSNNLAAKCTSMSISHKNHEMPLLFKLS